MNTATIEELAYLLRQAKEEGLPKPIVFLGAGASKTGGVPLAGEIITDILEKCKKNPKIQGLKEECKTYPKLMECLTPFERNKLLKEYIDNAKINVTHIYLAQLLIEGFIDYVLTVNFDNLMLRALALFNNFPATYDMAILKDLTTTSFKEKSVVYLHGQHHGLWLLNTPEEMAKVKEIVPRIIDSIKDQRPWIFIGYSGEDPIFEHITNIVRFDNGLYWVTHNDKKPNEKVCSNLLDKANTNTFLIRGYDSDSFMLKLSAELISTQPIIIDKPFSSLKHTLENIVDIDEKEHFKGVKERLEIVKKDVDSAIQQFEEGKIETNENRKKELEIKFLKKQIIDIIINENFDPEEVSFLEKSTLNLNNQEINNLMSVLLNSWADIIHKKAKLKNDEQLYLQSFEKYKRGTELNPFENYAFNNWGNAITDLAKLKSDEELYLLSFEKYKIASELNPKDVDTFYNWANTIADLAKLKSNEQLYLQSFEKYKIASELNPKDVDTFYNWANAIADLAKLKSNEQLYLQSFEKYKIAAELNPKDTETFNNWGVAILDLANLKSDEQLYLQSFEKFKIASELNSKDEDIFCNWGNAISDLAELKSDEQLYLLSFEKYKIATELNPKDNVNFFNWGNTISALAKLKSDEELYLQSFEKYKIATELNPNESLAFEFWGIALYRLANLKNDKLLFDESFDKLKIGIELNGEVYNLACFYAMKKDKLKALKTLEDSLKRNEETSEFVEIDDDWQFYWDDADFKVLIEKYRKINQQH